jgi:nucleoside-diphosphate-sugar epimerase
MRLLILGGTGVISTGITKRLLDQGDSVTLFNRGQTDNPFAARVTTVIGSRQSRDDLAAVAARNFDAVIDMIGYTEADGRVAIETTGDLEALDCRV